ncbi:MAG: hypothetical protein DCC50_02100 [Acidobacteria bacterium]|nr:MAG: hypothetical protein DCC50_02100 [Acidobacteriota bacterium]
MSWQDRHDRHDAPREVGLDDELRSVLGGSAEHFDYDALVAGTKVRARRMRRRRAVAQGAAAAVLVPTLVGAGFLLNSSVRGSQDAVPAGPPTGQVLATQDDSAATSAPPALAEGPPYQDPALLPEVTPDAPNPDVPNRWELPDVRPTGIDFLDELGAPRYVAAYPRIMPLDGMIAGTDGVEPHSGLSWYYFDGTNDMHQDTVEITLTAWDDSEQVMDALRAGEPVSRAGWDGRLQVRPWPAHHDDDHLLVDLVRRPMPTVGALVRQGDYLLGVTVQADSYEDAADVAGGIAERAAANLAWLDPDHGQG